MSFDAALIFACSLYITNKQPFFKNLNVLFHHEFMAISYVTIFIPRKSICVTDLLLSEITLETKTKNITAL